LILSFIIVILFIFYHLINEYTLSHNFRDHAVRVMHDNAMYAAHDITENSDWDNNSGYFTATSNNMMQYYSHIKEFTLFSLDGQASHQGTYTYHDANNDYSYIQAAKDEQFVYRPLHQQGVSYYRTYFWTEELGPYVLSIVYDTNWLSGILQENRKETLLYSIGIVILVLLISYWFIGRMLYPLKDILWKVNEVSSARFHQPIQISKSDEFGVLALSVNAMSQNLSIYMEKLRKAFEENRRMKEHLESFINNTNDAIYLVDLNGRVIQVNQAYLALFEYEIDEVLDKAISIVPESYLKEVEERYRLLLEGKTLPALETFRKAKSGELIPVSVAMSAIRDNNGTIFAIASITRDMRSRNRMEELLRRSEKLTTVGRLAAGVAHEIRNPLTTLRGFLQLQKQTSRLDMQHVDLMLSELDRINFIVGEFLILAKPQAVKHVSKDVRKVMTDVTSLLDSEAHLYNIHFHLRFTEDSCVIACEENQLKQVFINLLRNAIEAMPKGGNIHIDIKHDNDQIVISIIDEGVGIPEDLLKRIGDPFFTGKDTGTGLGIMVSQRIIQSHKGTLDIHSQENVGTTVVVSLPVLKDSVSSVIL